MKQLFILTFTLLQFSCCISQPLKLGVISDIHYLSENLMDEGVAANKYAEEGGRNLKETPVILNKVISDYLASGIDVLLIPGDITRNGEKQSHLDFVAKLRPLMDKGVRVFVVPGNHDINMPNSVCFKGADVLPVPTVSPAEFEQIYQVCGYASAIRRDTASLSYVASLDDKTWLLALDGCRYKEYTNTSISAGKLSAATESWAVEVLEEAKEQNIRVISMMHHGLVEHIIYQDMLFPQYLIDDWKRLVGLFADKGLKAVFTGHFHANDITGFTSDNEHKIYDIETGALSTYPYPYRFVELSDKGMDISTRKVKYIPSNPDLIKTGKTKLKDWAQNLAATKIRERGYTLPDETLSQLTDIVADIMVLHMEGDEVVNENLQQKIKKLAGELGSPISLPPSAIQLDFPPADGDVYLSF
ncbi:metallophosphoesterase family protein [Viscerimonas tarda]